MDLSLLHLLHERQRRCQLSLECSYVAVRRDLLYLLAECFHIQWYILLLYIVQFFCLSILSVHFLF